MEPKSDIPKLPDMVMCGDHPSFTKTELNAKEAEPPAAPGTRAPPYVDGFNGSLESYVDRAGERGERRERGASAHALRPDAPRRRLDAVPENRALVQAALGSFRWPPYLLAVWVLVLVATHALHCLVGVLERALPQLRQLGLYFRQWTEETWKGELDARRALPIALALVTGLVYSAYFVVYLAYSVALWAVEPLCIEPKPERDGETRVTDYEEGSKSDSSVTNPNRE